MIASRSGAIAAGVGLRVGCGYVGVEGDAMYGDASLWLIVAHYGDGASVSKILV